MTTAQHTVQRHPATPHSAAPSSAAPHPWIAYALIGGGALMVAMYTLEIYTGLATGALPFDPPNAGTAVDWAAGMAFSGGLLGIGIALTGLALWLRRHAPRLATVALVLAALGALPAAYNVLSGVTPLATIPPIGGISVLTALGSATLLGIAALRTQALPRRISWTLIVVGLVTFPLILLTIPLEQVLPPFVVMDLPFPIWGVIFAAIGVTLLRQRRSSAA